MAIPDIVIFCRERAQVDANVVARGTTDSDLNSAEGRAVVQAIKQYSVDRPLVRAVQVAQSAAGPYDMSLVLPAWNQEWRVQDVMYPIGDTYEDFVPRNSWRFYINYATGKPMLKFLLNAPDGPFLVIYSRPHNMAVADEYTIPLQDEEAVGALASFHLCTAAQAHYARKTESQFNTANQVNYAELARRYRDAAKSFKDDYTAHIAKKSEHQKSLGMFTWENSSSADSEGWVFHRSESQ